MSQIWRNVRSSVIVALQATLKTRRLTIGN